MALAFPYHSEHDAAVMLADGEARAELVWLDGFVMAVAISPEAIPAREWIAAYWGGTTPDAAATPLEMRDRRKQLVTAFRDTERQLKQSPEIVWPLLWGEHDWAALAPRWADGFRTGMELRPGAWAAALSKMDDRQKRLLAPILALANDADGAAFFETPAERRQQVQAAAAAALPVAVGGLNAYCRPLRKPPKPRAAGANAKRARAPAGKKSAAGGRI
jgi:yecA family protein